MTMVWVFSPRQHRHPLKVCAFVQGLMVARKTGDILGNTERGVVCHPIHRPCVGVFFFLLEGSHAPWIAGPELSGWLGGEILTHRRCLGANSRPA